MKLKIGDISLPKQAIILKTSKNKQPRLIPLVGHAHSVITALLEKKIDTNPHSLLFPSPEKPLNPYDIETAWQAALKRADIKDYRFHDNRHTNASVHAAKGRNLLEIGSSIGHESIQSSGRYEVDPIR